MHNTRKLNSAIINLLFTPVIFLLHMLKCPQYCSLTTYYVEVGNGPVQVSPTVNWLAEVNGN